VPRGKGKPRSLALDAPILALAFGDDELVLAGCGDGRLRAIVVGDGEPMVRAELDRGAAVRAVLIVDAGAALATTADGALHRLTLEVRDARPTLTARGRVAVAERGLDAIAVEGGVIVVGGVDGAWVVDGDRARPLAVGGDGGVRALVGLGDGRIVAGCGDGAVRTAYVVGEAEAADRAGANAHAGAVRALALGPLLVDGAGRELARRLWSLGEDGALKSWPLDSNRKPRTLELGAGPGTALAIAVGAVKGVDGSTAQVIAVTAARKLVVQTLGADGEPVGNPAVTAGELERLAADLEDHKPKSQGVRAAAVITLGALPEDEARLSLERALARDPAPEVKIAAAQVLAQGGRRRARPALRAALGDGNAKARAAAFAALIALEAAEPLAAIRAGLAARAEDVRVLALDALAAQPPEHATAALAADGSRRRARGPDRAFAVARALGAADPRWAVRTALARGPADLRARALFTLGRSIAPTTRRPGRWWRRRSTTTARGAVGAYAVALCARPRLAGQLRAVDATLAASLIDAAARVGVAGRAASGRPPSRAARDDERAPLFRRWRAASPRPRCAAPRLVYLGDPRALGRCSGCRATPTRRAPPPSTRWRWPRAIAGDDRALAAGLAARRRRPAGAGRGDRGADRAHRRRAPTPSSIWPSWRCAEPGRRADPRAGAADKHGPRPGGGPPTRSGRRARRRGGRGADRGVQDRVGVARRDAAGAAGPAPRSRHADLRGQVVAELARRRARARRRATPPRRRAGGAGARSGGRGGPRRLRRAGRRRRRQQAGPGRARADVHLAAMASPRASVRAAGADGGPPRAGRARCDRAWSSWSGRPAGGATAAIDRSITSPRPTPGASRWRSRRSSTRSGARRRAVRHPPRSPRGGADAAAAGDPAHRRRSAERRAAAPGRARAGGRRRRRRGAVPVGAARRRRRDRARDGGARPGHRVRPGRAAGAARRARPRRSAGAVVGRRGPGAARRSARAAGAGRHPASRSPPAAAGRDRRPDRARRRWRPRPAPGARGPRSRGRRAGVRGDRRPRRGAGRRRPRPRSAARRAGQPGRRAPVLRRAADRGPGGGRAAARRGDRAGRPAQAGRDRGRGGRRHP
jgi:HEAT repeat protein